MVMPLNVLPELVMVWVVPPEKVRAADPTNAVPEPLVQFPYTVVAPNAMVIALVLPDMSTLGTYAMAVSNVMVPVTEPALVNVAVSCGRGKLSVDGEPVDVAAQPFALQF